MEYLSSYSSPINPIELVFSILKHKVYQTVQKSVPVLLKKISKEQKKDALKVIVAHVAYYYLQLMGVNTDQLILVY